MDHPCHKCGHSIEDGKAFCLQCGAPQIRVAVAEPPSPTVAGNVSSDGLTAFSLDPPSAPIALSAPALATRVQWPRALRVCAVAALVSLVIIALRLMVPLLAVFGAGCLAVILYRYRNPAWQAGVRSGAQLGAVTALLSSGVIGIFSAIAFAVLQAGGQARQQVLDALQQVATRSSDPQVQAALDLLKTSDGLGNKLVLALIVFFLISVAAGSLAGALTSTFIGRRKRP
jgi:zinc-ribbon domain